MKNCEHQLKAFLMSFWTIVIFLICGCGDKECSLWGFDPVGAESIYESGITSDTEGFEIVEEKDQDGSCSVIINHLSFPKSGHCRLYSPNGNLRIIASGPELQCGYNGYRIDYDEKGRVCCVTDIGENNEMEPSAHNLKEWLHESLCKKSDDQYSISVRRDEDGNISSIGNVGVPSEYKAKFYIKEWGPFWESDIDGGCLGFFVIVEKVENVDGSYVNYMYCNDKLIAELAYWKGVFIKARTYNKNGIMVETYTDRDVNVEYQAFLDQWTNPKWYVDK